MSISRRLSFLVFAALVVVSAVSCSTFERDWTARRRVATAPDSFVGCWEGTWTSAHNGHTGGLRAIVTPLAGGRFDVRYHATYDILVASLSFEYGLPVVVVRDGDALRFQGSADLGWYAGGEYSYDGTCRRGVLRSEYRAAIDHGVFELRRPVGPAAARSVALSQSRVPRRQADGRAAARETDSGA